MQCFGNCIGKKEQYSMRRSGSRSDTDIPKFAPSCKDKKSHSDAGPRTDKNMKQKSCEATSVVVGKGLGQGVGSEEVLLRIPGAVAHLIDGQESVHLATGDFTLVRLSHDGNGIAVFAEVGEELQWPLAKDVPTAKLDGRHYFFSLHVPPETEEAEENGEHSDESNELNYGVTFAAEVDEIFLLELDKYLEQYSYFWVPTVVQGAPERKEELDQLAAAAERKAEAEGVTQNRLELLGQYIFGKSNPPANPTAIPDAVLPAKLAPSDVKTGQKQQLVEQSSAAYWTTLAPNVEDYSSTIARGIATGTGHIIMGLFWCSDATIAQLEKGGLYMKGRIKPKDTPIHISPSTMKNLRRVRKMSKMTMKVTQGVLTGIVSTAGVITGSVIKSKAGKKIFELLPGEVALVSLDAFGKVFDAVELAGKNVLNSTSAVTTGLVSHRYGEEAGEATKEGLATAGHVVGTAWTVSKIRKALNPKDAAKSSKTGVLKSAGKVVLSEARSKKAG